MKNKLLTTICILTVLICTGCSKKEAEPVVSEAVEEIEKTEPVEETEIVEDIVEEEPTDVEADDEFVEGTTLTQEEIDELKANSADSAFQVGLEAYKAITSGGTYTSKGSVGEITYTKVVGTPSEDGWVWFDDAKGTIYFDYDAWYADATANPVQNTNPPELVDSDDEYWSSID